jgi:MFS family permease
MNLTARQILFTLKGIRSLGDGMMSVALAQYAIALGLTGLQTGLVASSALVGTAVATMLVGRYVERLGRRRVLIWGALLTAATGVAYAGSTHLPLLVLVAFFGTVNPTSGDVSAFLPVEQAILAQQTESSTRVNTFAWFNVIGSLAGGVGALLSGATGFLDNIGGVDRTAAIRILFATYSVLGVLSLLLVLRLNDSSELAPGERRGGLGVSRKRVFTLAGLFSIDSFAGGMAVQSIIALFLFRKFDLDPALTGAVFLATNFLSAASFLASARLSNRFGLVNTMVFTHLPSNAFLVAVALAPSAGLAIVFLMARSLLSQMDVPPRQTLVMSVVDPEERAAAAATTGLARSISSSAGPSIGGALFGVGLGAPFIACAALKSTYDLLLWGIFRNVRPK